jgi:pyrimidine-specific ribonucleoside hydrolase
MERGVPSKIPLMLEMETSDPDDFLTLCFLLDHPHVDLLGVTLVPGTEDQVALVEWALGETGREHVPIGVWKPYSPQGFVTQGRTSVSTWHYKVFGRDIPRTPSRRVVTEAGVGAYEGTWLIERELKRRPDATMLIGSAPKSFARLSHPERLEPFPPVARWVQQGGFAGDSLVAPEHRLAKFAGKETCPTFNLNGDPKGVLRLLKRPEITRRRFVSKNVCHGVLYDAVLDAQVQPTERPGQRLFLQGAKAYLAEHGRGKALHDTVAAAVVLDESVCTFAEVEIYRAGGGWGARPKPGSPTAISIAIDREKFAALLSV